MFKTLAKFQSQKRQSHQKLTLYEPERTEAPMFYTDIGRCSLCTAHMTSNTRRVQARTHSRNLVMQMFSNNNHFDGKENQNFLWPSTRFSKHKHVNKSWKNQKYQFRVILYCTDCNEEG